MIFNKFLFFSFFWVSRSCHQVLPSNFAIARCALALHIKSVISSVLVAAAAAGSSPNFSGCNSITADERDALFRFLEWYENKRELFQKDPIGRTTEEMLDYFNNLDVSDDLIKRLPKKFQHTRKYAIQSPHVPTTRILFMYQ